jgi:hypothetical protein
MKQKAVRKAQIISFITVVFLLLLFAVSGEIPQNASEGVRIIVFHVPATRSALSASEGPLMGLELTPNPHGDFF